MFQAHGQDPKQARLFKNVIHLPLFDKPDSSLFLTFIAPMELHLLLGVVNHLFKALKEAWPKADDWPRSLHIKSQPFHGGQFAGNECRKLLKNVDVLRQLAEQDCAFNIFGIINTLQKFDAVVSSCFGSTLDPHFASKIQAFRASYLSLQGVSVTPKVHAVFFHVEDVILLKKESLGKYSEHATEALHHSFKYHWERYKKPNNHPEYAKWLKTCMVDFNSKSV